MFIYVIVCSETLKIYIGQHKQADLGKYLSRKFWDANHHTSGRRSHLYNAMQRHPRESWSIHSLVSDIENRQELDALEKHYIQALNSRHPAVGYNICRGGEGFTGPHTEEWRKETLDRINQYWASPENRAQRSQEMKARWTDPAFQQARAEWCAANPDKLAYWAGKTRSEDSKLKASQGMIGKQQRLGQTRSAEEKEKTSISLKQFYQKHPAGPLSEEHKAKLKVAHQHCSCPRHVAKRQEQDFLIHK